VVAPTALGSSLAQAHAQTQRSALTEAMRSKWRPWVYEAEILSRTAVMIDQIPVAFDIDADESASNPSCQKHMSTNFISG
jgi:hypothetical protein